MAEIAERLGRPFKPWQRHVVDVALEIDPETGLLAYPEVVLIAPRQVGKSELMLPVMTHRCVGFEHAGPQRVLYTAQTADLARLKWRDVHLARLNDVRLFRGMFQARLTQNKEAFEWGNGSMWMPGSTTGKTAGTGDTLDLGVIDEAWSRPDNRTELGMLPTMDTRPWAQLWVLSMIPGLSRVRPDEWPYLRAKRVLGRARVEAGVRTGMAFFDYAAADGLDPGDPGTWWSFHPGLGHTTTEAKIRARYEGLDLVDFCAEYLGWEPMESAPRWLVVSRQTWRDRLDPGSCIEGRPALSVEMDEERSRGWIGAAGFRPDGDYHVEVVEPGYQVPLSVTGVDWMERRALEIVEKWDPSTVVIDPRRPAASLIVPLRNRGVEVLAPSQNAIAGACGRFFDATGENRPVADDADDEEIPADDGRRLWHLGQRVLDRALGQAQRFELGAGSFVFVRRGSSAELGPLYLVTLALHGLVVVGGEAPPEIFV